VSCENIAVPISPRLRYVSDGKIRLVSLTSEWRCRRVVQKCVVYEMLSLIWSRTSIVPSHICNLCSILCDGDSTCSLKKFVSFIHVSLHYMHSLAPYLFSWKKVNEFEPANADITFRITLREYIHVLTINLKPVFHVSSLDVRMVCTTFHPRIGAVCTKY